jgi:hypothetical protein
MKVLAVTSNCRNVTYYLPVMQRWSAPVVTKELLETAWAHDESVLAKYINARTQRWPDTLQPAFTKSC